jgi:ribosomal protein L9
LQIRQFIKKTKDLDQVVVTDKFFDSVSFWQQAYERSEAAQSKLQDQVHELNQRIEGLLAKLRVKVSTNDNGTFLANKRKASVGKNANSSNMARKRIKLPKSLEKRIPLMGDDDSEEEEDGIWSH